MCDWNKDSVYMPLAGRVRTIDNCISKIIAALNAGEVYTDASCCGHNKHHGTISLVDGRWMIILKDRDEWERVEKILDAPPIN